MNRESVSTELLDLGEYDQLETTGYVGPTADNSAIAAVGPGPGPGNSAIAAVGPGPQGGAALNSRLPAGPLVSWDRIATAKD